MEKKYIGIIAAIIGASLITVLGITIPIIMKPTPPPPDDQILEPYWPTEEWRNATAEELGMTSSKFEDMYDYILNNSINLHSVLIISDNYIVDENFLENYTRREEKNFAPHWMVHGAANHTHNIYSCTKSITSLLIGMAMEMGYIDNLSQTIYEFLEEDYWDPGLDPRKKNVTIYQLLTQTAGFPFGGYDPNQSYINQSLAEPLSFDPGTGWMYSNAGPNILSGIINITTGMSASEFARQYLFEPIGISQEDWTWNEDFQGVTNGASGISMSPRAMAKIGILCLNNGSWNATQLVPKDWILESTAPHPLYSFYGYLWWPNPIYYLAGGAYGQWITVIPEYDIIVIFTADIPEGSYSTPYDYIIQTFIIGGVT
jgi:hypothetical protein